MQKNTLTIYHKKGTETRLGWLAISIAAGLFLLLGGCELLPPLGSPPTPIPTVTSTVTFTPTVTPTETVTPVPMPTNTPTITPTPSEVTEITWFVGLGAGSDAFQVIVEKSVVDDFNNSQGFIHLNLEVVPNTSAAQKLTSEIAADEGPDIIGPVGFSGANSFHGDWLDLTPYISAADTEAYNPALLKMYQTDEGQVALPFAEYPSVLFYNKKLFDAAHLKYPPAKYGDKYKMPDGSQLEWTWDTLAQVARLLTLDAGGLNATQNGFNKNAILQYGYSWTFETHPNYWGSFWGSGSMLGSDGKTAQLPDAWKAAWEWTYDGIQGDQPFMATHKVDATGTFGYGNAFSSGKVGMTVQPSWYTCCMSDVKTWDAAAVPAYNGQPGGRVDADTFRIWKGSSHPREAYIAMSYLLNQGVQKLIVGSHNVPAYGAMSARKDQQQAWIKTKKQSFRWVTNWDIFIAGLDYPDVPVAEGYMPNYKSAWARGQEFADRLLREPGLDMATEEQAYLDALNEIFAK